MSIPKPVVLCILDGWGASDTREGNAPALARTPTMDHIMANCPNNTLTTFGPDVGLPSGQMGNSEVGHTNIGAGRVVAMDLGQIDLAIEDGSFFDNAVIVDFADKVTAAKGTAHLIGLTSKGGVHAHQDHMIAAAKLLSDRGVPVAIHIITDGRDVPPTQAFHDILEVEKSKPKDARVATVSGRYYALDRDNRWKRVEQAWRTMVLAKGDVLDDAQEGVATCYDLDQTDEFIEPFVVSGYDGMKDGDGVFFLNFRADRAREILSAIGDPDFDAFDVTGRPNLSALLGMVDYSEAHDTFMTTAFPKQDIPNTLGEWVSKQGKTQFRLAETEKYPHVTFFLNGGVETPVQGEERFMPKSPDVATYDMQPEMSEGDVTDRFVQAIEQGYDLIVTNYANPDMVGHTGDLDAAIKACDAVDAGLGRVLKALEAKGGAMIICADHGNCEMMIDPETGGPHTAHTLNPVPVAVVGMGDVTLSAGKLGDLAPTLLHMMGLDTPPEMTGTNLIT